MNKLQMLKFTLDYQDEFLKNIEALAIQQIVKLILETPFEKVIKGYKLAELTRLQKPHLFEIQAVKNISEPLKTRYTNTKDGMLQFIFYPNIVAITIEKQTNIELDLFLLEGKKIMVPSDTEICRSILLLKKFSIISEPSQLL